MLTKNLLLEMKLNQIVKQEVREAVMTTGSITTNHSSQTQTTECSSGLLLLRYYNHAPLIIYNDSFAY